MTYARPLCLVALGLLCWTPAGAAEYNWSLFTAFNPNDIPTKVYRSFAEDVREATKGRLEIQVFSGGELPYKNSDALRAISTRQVEMADMPLGPVAGDVPELNVFGLPFICTSFDGFYSAADDVLPIIDRRLQDGFGVRALTNWTMPPQQIWLRDGIEDIGGLAGRKIRTWNNMQIEMLSRLGANAVAITPAEVIPALQRGVVDGGITATTQAYDWRFYDVLDYGYMLNITMTNDIIAVNEQAFEELPEDVRIALVEVANNYQGEFRKALESAESTARERLREEGMTLVEPTVSDLEAARSKTASMWDDWVEQNGEVARELLDAVISNCSN